MQESLLHFIWQFTHFNTSALQSEEGESIEIIHPGTINHNQGPDFLEAKIKIAGTLLVGSVEIHVKSSDWNVHKHSGDANYSNVILHVVWEYDVQLNENFSTLCLQNIVPKVLLEKYSNLMQNKSFVFCENYLPALSTLGWLQWKERLAAERLERKSKDILVLLQENKNHWEETFWQIIARNFGIKVNADIFFDMAKLISINVLAKHKHQIHQLEALLLGTACVLPENSEDDYVKLLVREYSLLQRKFSLQQVEMPPKFLRMRPAAFPSVRLAQLAMLIHSSSHLFARVKESESVEEVKNMFSVRANDYWHYHYIPGDEEGDYMPKKLGVEMINNIIINTIIPMLFTYGKYYNQQAYKDKALDWLQQLKSENNTIIREWKKLGIAALNALESQALIELKNNYCNDRKCLSCNVAKTILKQ